MRRLLLCLLVACDPPAAAPDAEPDDDDAAPPPDGLCGDLDDDGYPALACGGADCDDGDPEVHPGAPDARWRFDAIAPSNLLGAAIRGDDRGWHVAWSDGGAWYASGDGDAWAIERVDASPAAGIDVSLALAPDGTPHLAYVDLELRALRHAVRGDAGWTVETVDATEYAGYQADVEIDGAGRVAILHTRHVAGGAGDELRWSWREGAAWQTEIVATDVRRHHGIAAALDGDGAVIAWIAHGDRGLGVATGGPGAWTRAALPEHAWVEWGVDVAVDAGAAYVVAGTLPTLFVRSPDGTWASDDLALTGYHPRLAVAGGAARVAVRAFDDTGESEAIRLLDATGASEIVSTGGIFRPRIAARPTGELAVLAAHPETGTLRLHRDLPDAADHDCDGAP